MKENYPYKPQPKDELYKDRTADREELRRKTEEYLTHSKIDVLGKRSTEEAIDAMKKCKAQASPGVYRH